MTFEEDINNERNWTLNFIESVEQLNCLICGEPLAQFPNGSELKARCSNGHELILRMSHQNT